MRTLAVSFLTIFALGLLSFTASDGQTIAEDVEVKDLFDQPEKVLWVRHYQGLMNDMHDVIVSLGSDGKDYKGYLLFQRSEESFLLRGNVNKDSLFLEEIGKGGQISGYILGQLTPKRILADWQNVEKNMASSLQLKLMSDQEVDPQYCGDDKWVHDFHGKIDQEEVEILLQRQNKDFVTGYLYNASKSKIYPLKGTICSGNCKLVVSDHKLEEIGTLNVNMSRQQLEGTIKWEDLPISTFTLKEEHQMEVSCVEYADFNSAFNALYPSLQENNDFNDYIFNQVKNWLAQSRTQNVKTINANKPTDRLSSRAYAWFDIAHISDKMISGYLVGNNTWSGSFRAAFNYNLATKETIGYEDLFELTPRFHEFISENVAEALAHKPFFEEPEFQVWVFNQKFDMIAIRQNGIEFSSSPNMLYGAHKVMISYEDLKPYFILGNPLEYLYLADTATGDSDGAN